MPVAIFLGSLLGAMALGMPIAYALLVSAIALMAHLDGYSLSHQRPLTVPLVRSALAELEAPS